MSYDISIFKKEVAEKCQEENLSIGELLENRSPLITNFSESEISFFKEYFLGEDNYLGRFKLISDEDGILVFDYRNEVTATIFPNYISFKTGFSNQWELTMATMDLMLQTDRNVVRFDFQDGQWG